MTRSASLRDDIVALIDDTGFGAHGLHVLAGEAEAEHQWAGDVRRDIQSVAKAVAVLAALIADDEGVIDLDAPVSEVLGDLAYGAGADAVTLRDLLTMRSGIDLPWTPTLLTDWPDLAAEFLSRPTEGRSFQYSNASTYVAMRVLAERVGDVRDYAVSRLFEPLTIPDVTWTRCPLGFIAGGEGVMLRTEELARIGRLIRDGGVWRGAQIVPEAGVAAMHAGWGEAFTSPGYERYALSGWDGPGDGWRLHGAHGQLVLFRGDVVVTITADDHFAADDLAAGVMDLLAARD